MPFLVGYERLGFMLMQSIIVDIERLGVMLMQSILVEFDRLGVPLMQSFLWRLNELKVRQASHRFSSLFVWAVKDLGASELQYYRS
jgi:hypothetical protein